MNARSTVARGFWWKSIFARRFERKTIMKIEITRKHPGWQHFLWVLTAAVLGFATTAIFSGWLHMPRVWFLVPYVVLTVAFLYSYCTLVRHRHSRRIPAALGMGCDRCATGRGLCGAE